MLSFYMSWTNFDFWFHNVLSAKLLPFHNLYLGSCEDRSLQDICVASATSALTKRTVYQNYYKFIHWKLGYFALEIRELLFLNNCMLFYFDAVGYLSVYRGSSCCEVMISQTKQVLEFRKQNFCSYTHIRSQTSFFLWQYFQNKHEMQRNTKNIHEFDVHLWLCVYVFM